jgi:serine protease Do
MTKSIFTAITVLVAAIPVLAQETGWIGVRIEDQKDRGAIIRSVEPNSPAARAGLREGDVIIEFSSEPVIGVQQLTRLIRETPVGRTVDIKVRRDNRDETFQITPEAAARNGRAILELPDASVLRDRIIRQIPPINIQINSSITSAGVHVEQMSDQLRDFFGVFSNAGVLVSSVDRGSAAEKAGLKAGDVITSVDGRTIRTPAEFNREMRSGSSNIMLKVIREKQERDIAVERGTR